MLAGYKNPQARVTSDAILFNQAPDIVANAPVGAIDALTYKLRMTSSVTNAIQPWADIKVDVLYKLRAMINMTLRHSHQSYKFADGNATQMHPIQTNGIYTSPQGVGYPAMRRIDDNTYGTYVPIPARVVTDPISLNTWIDTGVALFNQRAHTHDTHNYTGTYFDKDWEIYTTRFYQPVILKTWNETGYNENGTRFNHLPKQGDKYIKAEFFHEMIEMVRLLMEHSHSYYMTFPQGR
jgi:hypothetical protein